MKYLNLGCGSHYHTNPVWTNIDFYSTGPGVIGHNLLRGIPLPSNTFDFVYHSHVLEHFSKLDGEKLIEECFRVLKPGGVLRIATPDLERIARNYLKFLEFGWDNPQDAINRSNHEWMLVEMYDQAARHKSGGYMAEYLKQPTIINEDFVYERLGEEGKAIRRLLTESHTYKCTAVSTKRFLGRLKSSIKSRLRKFLMHRLHISEQALEVGRFRLGGEIHQWMYDRYSLKYLMESKGGAHVRIGDAFESYLTDWSKFSLDGKDGVTRKADSIFIEALKSRSSVDSFGSSRELIKTPYEAANGP
jgi:predicted SAM-dependent methyltransferase